MGGRGADEIIPLGAEDLLPIVVYVVLRSRVSVLPAELELLGEAVKLYIFLYTYHIDIYI